MYLNKSGECDEQCLESNMDVALHILWNCSKSESRITPEGSKTQNPLPKDKREKKTREIQDGAEFWIKSAAQQCK